MEAVGNEIPPGTLQVLILKSLAVGGVMHGYAISQFIEATSEGVLQVEESALYPALRKLLDSGWVSAEWGTSARNRRTRYFSIAPEGIRRLEEAVPRYRETARGVARVLHLD